MKILSILLLAFFCCLTTRAQEPAKKSAATPCLIIANLLTAHGGAGAFTAIHTTCSFNS